MKEKNCILIGAGDLTVSEIPVGEEDLCIAVDGGFEYCKMLGIEPDYIIGDFDSVGDEQAEVMKELSKTEGDKIIVLPVNKDDTDMLAAIKLGLSKGCQSFRIYGGMGGRLEHTMANIQCLLYLKERNAVGYLMDGTGMILVAKEETISFRENLEGYLSIFSMGSSCRLSLDNLKYTLKEKELFNSYPLGISNEFLEGKKATVQVHEGTALLILNLV
ncbi:MAG: thiamine diphosphokinase [Lachnospiraceae bacterium]|nr:thiamine diphosphokinase [Lachnospiraceae bacterium]